MKGKQHTDSFTMAGKTEPAKDEETTTWMNDKSLRHNSPEQSVLILFDKSMVYMIDHSKKKYSEIPFSTFETVTTAAQMDGLPDFVKDMMKMTIIVEPTTETKTIGSWNCKKYKQTLKNSMMGSESEVWATTDVKLNADLYKKYTTTMLAFASGMMNSLGDMSKEFQKIQGISVFTKTVSTVMNNQITSTSEITEIKENSAPAGTYEVPPKYKKKDLDK
jgi:hypothetical protein